MRLVADLEGHLSEDLFNGKLKAGKHLAPVQPVARLADHHEIGDVGPLMAGRAEDASQLGKGPADSGPLQERIEHYHQETLDRRVSKVGHRLLVDLPTRELA